MGKIDSDLSALIGAAKTPNTETPEVQDSETPKPSKPKKSAAPKKGSGGRGVATKTISPAAESQSTGDSSGGGAKYLTLVPKEARLREDQIAALNDLARTLGRTRTDKTERITSNTLIRIAIDKLIQDQAVLAGDNEVQLRTNYLNS